MSLLDIVLRSSALVLIAALAAMLGRRTAAAHRHYIWMLVMGGLLALPMLTRVVPWKIAVLPSAQGAGDRVQRVQEQGAESARSQASLTPAPGSPLTPAPRTQPVAAPIANASWSIAPMLKSARFWWLAGLSFAVVRLLFAAVALWRLMRGAREVEDAEWQRALARAADQLGVRAPVRLLESPRAVVPMTFGLRHPVVILPPDAGDWPSELRDVVLLHELAHIRRGDARANIISQVVCAIYWFHPLVWGAARRLRIEAEKACDDLVLGAGAPPSAYANHLLSMVQQIARLRAPAFAMPLAQRSAFEGRVLAILEPGVPRQTLSSRAMAVGVVVLMAVAVPLAALDRAAQAEEPQQQQPGGRHARSGKFDTLDRTRLRSETRTAILTAMRDSGMIDARRVDAQEETAVLSPQQVASAAQALAQALGDSDEGVRVASARALGELEHGDTAAINALINALRRDASREVRKTAAWALGEIEDARAVPGMLPALREERDAEVRKQIVWAFGQIESELAVDGLGAALRSESDIEVKRMIVWALGEIESADAVPFLTPILRDSDVEMRKQAAWALGEIEAAAAVEPLMAAFQTERNTDVREMIVWALGEIEDRRAAPVLEQALRDTSVEIRRKAIWALGELDDLRSAPAGLVAATRDSDVEVRRAAVHALAEIEDPGTVGALAAAIHDDDIEVKREAIRGLGEIRGTAAVEALVAAMRDTDPEIRRLAAQALGNR